MGLFYACLIWLRSHLNWCRKTDKIGSFIYSLGLRLNKKNAPVSAGAFFVELSIIRLALGNIAIISLVFTCVHLARTPNRLIILAHFFPLTNPSWKPS
jgi:hypothetical protein